MDIRQRKALVNQKWPSDIQRLRAERDILECILNQKNKAFILMNEKFKNYIKDLGFLVKEKARLAKNQKENSATGEEFSYNMGYMMAFHEIVDLMKQQAKAFNITDKEICMHDIDPDADLL